tara:strand:- start:513 stop:941 length:429 start_codon:yes stop_codon:yes gene_type:complete
MINGIKPIMMKTTELRIKPTSFDDAMEKFCIKLEENVKPEVERFNHMKSVTFRQDGGLKYIKVKSYTDRIHTEYNDDGTMTKSVRHDDRGSIHCFVEKQTGNIFKPATWRAPMLKGNCIRGNIYDSTTFEKTDMHGGWLYAR